jgi:hypothetical protein
LITLNLFICSLIPFLCSEYVVFSKLKIKKKATF